ncbi:PH domain-containing protein [Rothia sp. LK2588]|uniref:PH domain-containing protein n=1 Tax=Rothia sp. LK2588 TaxID=3114369 RepID=UPI0034CD023E
MHTSEPLSFTPISPRYFTVRLVQRAIWAVIYVALSAALLGARWLWEWQIPLWVCWIPVALTAVWQLIALVLTARYVRSWGYAETETHLVITRGVLARKVTTVPYGRMQLVDVTSGPIEGALKLASVELSTASMGTDAKIPGLETAEAQRLSEALSARGEEQMVGM